MTFERRRQGEMTTMYLGRVLEEYLGLPVMARRAREGDFDDYFCRPEIDDGMNMVRLVHELTMLSESIVKRSPQWGRIAEVVYAVKNGEFDGTQEEGDRWAASKEGQETFKSLWKPDE